MPPKTNRRNRRIFQEARELVRECRELLEEYIVFSESTSSTVIAGWIVAAHAMETWDRFAHLGICSPEKRSGKTRLLQVLGWTLPNAVVSGSVTAAAAYRLIANERCSLVIDEAQSLTNQHDDGSRALKELLNAAIDQDAIVLRTSMSGSGKVERFRAYCPKAFAHIGVLDSVLADRSLVIPLKRKAKKQEVKFFRTSQVKRKCVTLRDKITKTIGNNKVPLFKRYETIEPFPISNDRLAELLMPLQTILDSDEEYLSVIRDYANERCDHEEWTDSPGTILLRAVKEIYEERETKSEKTFIGTHDLLWILNEQRTHEPWATIRHGQPLNAHKLGALLRPYGIRSLRNKTQSERGFYFADFQEAWDLYL